MNVINDVEVFVMPRLVKYNVRFYIKLQQLEGSRVFLVRMFRVLTSFRRLSDVSFLFNCEEIWPQICQRQCSHSVDALNKIYVLLLTHFSTVDSFYSVNNLTGTYC